ncbi:MAG: hypothetical protein AB1749_03575 [Pseudomonadota bacterium]
MGVVSDELLMAYADGELDAAETRRVELRLAADPETSARLEVFQRTGRVLGGAIDLTAFADIPARLADTVRSGAPAACPEPRPALGTSGSQVGWLAQALRRLLPEPDLPWRLALALSGVLVLGTGLGWLLATIPGASRQREALVRSEGARLLADGALANALERKPSGAVTRAGAADADAIIAPRSTFASAAHEFCRHYRVDAGSGARSEGIACREADGQWRIEVQVALSAETPGREGGYAPAGGEDGTLIDEVLDRLIVGDPLDLRSEADMLQREWRKDRR